jgi:hypothetical protein
MNDCHPTDEVRAFMIRAQPIATRTPASGVQPRLRRGSGGWWQIEPVANKSSLPVFVASELAASFLFWAAACPGPKRLRGSVSRGLGLNIDGPAVGLVAADAAWPIEDRQGVVCVPAHRPDTAPSPAPPPRPRSDAGSACRADDRAAHPRLPPQTGRASGETSAHLPRASQLLPHNSAAASGSARKPPRTSSSVSLAKALPRPILAHCLERFSNRTNHLLQRPDN